MARQFADHGFGLVVVAEDPPGRGRRAAGLDHGHVVPVRLGTGIVDHDHDHAELDSLLGVIHGREPVRYPVGAGSASEYRTPT
ncbi:MAG: hypothetical protein ACFCVK_16930 [Acidimicrobiales bacterium]